MAEITDFRLGRIADLRFPAGANFALNSTFTGISLTGKTAILTARSPGQSVVWTRSGLTVGATTINFNIAPSGVDDSSRVFSSFCESGLTEYALTIYEPGGEITMRLQGTVEWAPPTGDFDAGTADSASVAVSVNAGAPVSVDVVSGATGSTTLDTNTVTSGLSGILKAASNTLEVATAGTDYVATNDSRLTDARTPTSHVHGGISNAGAIGSTSGLPIKTGASGVLEAGAFGTSAGQFTEGNDSRLSDARTPTSHVHGGISNAGAIGSTAGLPIKTGTSGVLEVGAFGTSSGQFAQGNDSRFHDRSHAMTSTSDHTAGNWKVFHSNNTGQLVELALGASGTYLKSNGASAAPTFDTPAGGGSSITGTGFAYVRTAPNGGNNATGTIGDPSKPYLTAQAAWEAGATRFDFGVGSFSIDAAFGSGGYSAPIYVQGAGIVGSIVTLTWRGEDGVEQNGFTAPDLNLSSDKSVYLLVAIEGGDATSAGSDTYNGGNIASHYFSNCYINTLTLTPGAGCNGGTSGTDATSSGAEFTTIVTGALQGSTIYKNAILEAGVFSPDKLSDGNKGNITVSASGTAWSVNQNSLQLDTLASASAKGKIVGRKTAGAGNFEECVITDFTGVLGGVYAEATDFTTSTGALVNVTGLSCPIAANEKLLVEVVGFKNTSSASDGMRFSFTGPTGASSVLFNLEAWTATTASRVTAVQSGFNTNFLEQTGNVSSFPFRATCTIINGGTGGTVQFQAGSEASGVSLTISRGAVMRVTRIA